MLAGSLNRNCAVPALKSRSVKSVSTVFISSTCLRYWSMRLLTVAAEAVRLVESWSNRVVVSSSTFWAFATLPVFTASSKELDAVETKEPSAPTLCPWAASAWSILAFSAFPTASESGTGAKPFTVACRFASWLLKALIFAFTVCRSRFQAAVTGPRSSPHASNVTRHRPITHDIFRFMVQLPSGASALRGALAYGTRSVKRNLRARPGLQFRSNNRPAPPSHPWPSAAPFVPSGRVRRQARAGLRGLDRRKPDPLAPGASGHAAILWEGPPAYPSMRHPARHAAVGPRIKPLRRCTGGRCRDDGF